MSERLVWRLVLEDKFSKPTAKAQRAVEQYQRAMARAARTQQRAEAAMIRGEQRHFQQLSRLNARSMREQARHDRSRIAAAQRATRQNRAIVQRNAQAQSDTFRGMVSTLGGFGLAAAGIVAGIASSFASMGFSAASAVVQIAAFRESSIASLEAVTGSSEQASRVFRNAMTVANQTPLDTADVVGMQQRFAVAGFNERETGVLTAASTDLSAAFGQARADSFALVAAQLRASGRANRGDLTQLLNSGVNTGDTLDNVARQLGISGANQQATRNAVLSRLSSGGVTGDQLLQGALGSISGRLDQGGALGGFARRQSQTLTGALSNLQNAGFNLIAGMDFSRVPGMQAFTRAVLAITNALDGAQPAGMALRAGITAAANAVGSLFARITPQMITATFGIIAATFQRVGAFATAAWPVVRAFVTGLGPGLMAGIAPLQSMVSTLMSGGAPSAATLQLIARAASGLGQALGFAVGTIAAFVGGVGLIATTVMGLGATFTGLVSSLILPIRTAFVSIGGAIVNGITDGVHTAARGAVDAVTGLGGDLVNAARGALGIHSPSRVFADVVGAQIPAGIGVGVRENAMAADGAVAELARPPRGIGRGLDGVNITLYVTVPGGPSPQATAQATVDAFEDQLSEIFGRLAEA